MAEVKDNKPNEVVINEKSMEILVAKFIPTSQYFERSFKMLQEQLRENKKEIMDFKTEVNDRFKQVDRRFEQVDKKIDDFKAEVNDRFKQVDKRFKEVDKKIDDFKEDVDKRFKEVNNSIINLTFKIEELTKAQEVTIRDYIIERDRHYDRKFSNLRMFNIATISLIAGIILKMIGIIKF